MPVHSRLPNTASHAKRLPLASGFVQVPFWEIINALGAANPLRRTRSRNYSREVALSSRPGKRNPASPTLLPTRASPACPAGRNLRNRWRRGTLRDRRADDEIRTQVKERAGGSRPFSSSADEFRPAIP